MKVYVVYESYYGEIIVDTGSSTNLIGVYSDIEKAKENVEDRVKEATSLTIKDIGGGK